MAKLELSDWEISSILEGLTKQLQSAKRGAVNTKDPRIAQCYKDQIKTIDALTNRILTAEKVK